jgi:hypothetical protein
MIVPVPAARCIGKRHMHVDERRLADEPAAHIKGDSA